MKKLFFPVFIIALVLVSCKKDKKETCVTSTASITGNYKISTARYKQSSSSSEIDYFALLDACEKDDVFAFAANGIFNYQDAGVVCSPNGSYSGTWSLSGTTALNLDGDPATIQSFDCSNMVVYLSDLNVSGDKLTITFVRQ